MEVNPLNVLNERTIDWLPKHFYTVEVSNLNTSHIHALSSWIYRNLKGRFCVTHSLNFKTIVFGFEEGAEASYFSLVYPTIK